MTPAGVVLVDSNVLLDVATSDPAWFEWSAGALAQLGERRRLAVDPIVDAEVSVGYERIEDVDDALPVELIAPEGA